MRLLTYRVHYKRRVKSVSWEGRLVESKAEFKRHLHEKVEPRLRVPHPAFAKELRELSTTRLETRFVERLLCAHIAPEAWQIGEAFAECVLLDTGKIHLPWNTLLERRTPGASPQGADLVGFYEDGPQVLLLIGEVKTSSEIATPPRVMRGEQGLCRQLERNAGQLEIQLTLWNWLRARCRTMDSMRLYKTALRRYISSQG